LGQGEGGEILLAIEEYIARRKKEDNLNEFDTNMRIDNMKVCVDYVFEYFNNYLHITQLEENTVLHNEKLDKYRNQLNEYETEIQEWLVKLFAEYGKQVNRPIIKILKQQEFFFLYQSDAEFRSVSYDCYSKLIKKYPFIKDQTEMLFIFIKDYHRIRSAEYRIPFISLAVNEWIENTWNQYQVNVVAFAHQWADYYYEHEELWPPTHRSNSKDTWRKYEYNFKQKSNLFNIDGLYRRMPKKPYIKGRKQELEIIMMHYWLHRLEGDEGYWEDYIHKVTPAMNPVYRSV
jgi:hypothetical protein